MRSVSARWMCPPIAETLTEEGGWNTAYPHYTLPQNTWSHETAVSGAGDESALDALGPRLLHDYNVVRSTTCSTQHIPDGLQDFSQKWEDWKRQMGARDFTDLLLDACEVLPRAPGNPTLIVVDEAQDCTPLQWRLLRNWSRACAQWIVAGDDDQALYTWCGASPRPMLDAADHEKIILNQSYRLPERIYAHAVTYLEPITTRQDKQWAPRQEEGRFASAFQPLVRLAEVAILDTMDASRTGSRTGSRATCAVLAPCSYMLEDTIAWMRHEGIPFANPWRLRRGDWNPLKPPARGIASRTRLLDFLRPQDRLWTWPEIATWLPLIREKGTLRPSIWQTLLALHEDDKRPCTLPELEQMCVPSALDGALRGDLAWLKTRLLATRAKALAYPLRIVERFGRSALADEPRIYVGTCHSVKGAEADTVVLSTALSRRFQMAVAAGGAEADAVWRMLYVGATRARESLIVTPLAAPGRQKTFA